MIKNTAKFLTVGAVAISASLMINGALAPNGHGEIEIPENDTHEVALAKYIGHKIINNIKDGIDHLYHNHTGQAYTQDTETYRFNVINNYMAQAPSKGFIDDIFSARERQDNLKQAIHLGVFKDTEAFKGELEILKTSLETSNPELKPLSIIDKDYYAGILNLEQAKENIGVKLAQIRNANSTLEAKAPNKKKIS